MPARNSIKQYAADNYYHVYNRGSGKQTIFHNDDDYRFFLYLLKRHLSSKPIIDKYGREYRHLAPSVSLVTYCLMPNHFHLLLFTHKEDGMELLMRSVITAYSMYYNHKYDHSGRLFQGAYKASLINNDAYLQHVTRYIHRNPASYKDYKYSSYTPLVKQHKAGWLSNILFDDIFDGTIIQYEDFVADYDDYKKMIDAISDILAYK